MLSGRRRFVSVKQRSLSRLRRKCAQVLMASTTFNFYDDLIESFVAYGPDDIYYPLLSNDGAYAPSPPLSPRLDPMLLPTHHTLPTPTPQPSGEPELERVWDVILRPYPVPLDTTSSATFSAIASESPVASSSPGATQAGMLSPTVTFASASVSPPQQKRHRSLTANGSDSEESERPSKRVAPSSPPLVVFEVKRPPSPSCAPVTAKSVTKPQDQCRCRNKTKKPLRHWRTACPFNPNRSDRLSCEIQGCGATFNRADNRTRHYDEYHPGWQE